MSVIATALKHLIAAGVAGDDLVRAVAEMEEATTPDTRSGAAKRQARYRERVAERNATHNETSQNVTRDDNVTLPPSLDKETSPRPPKEINPNPVVCISRARGDQFPCPTGCEPQHWQDILANRKAKRLPMTKSAYEKLLRDLEKYSDPDWPHRRILAVAAERGWAAIYNPKDRDDRNGTGKSNSQQGLRGSRPDPAFDMYQHAVARQAEEDSGGYREADSGIGVSLPSYLTG